MQKSRKKCAVIGADAGRIGAIGVLLAVITGCPAQQDVAAIKSVTDAETLSCGEQGYLSTDLYGAIATPIRWAATDLECAGMPRPGGEGARLRFAGRSVDNRSIAIIVAMPDLDRDAQDKEYASTVTLIEEGSGRFFNSADLNNCWTEITSLQPIGDSDDKYTIGGALYCVSPLAEVNGDSSVSISELEFQGLLDWNAS